MSNQRVRVGLIADPDSPEQMAHALADELPRHLDERFEWSFEVEVDPVTAGQRAATDILNNTRGHLERHGWDYAISVTDLPLRYENRPVLAEVNVDAHVGMVSLPALGGTQPRRRTRQVITQLLDELLQPRTEQSGEGADEQRHGLKSPLTEILAPIHRESTTSHDEIDVRYRSTKLRGRIRLLTGMVHTNRPWKLIFGLSSALAAAVATSAFGFSSSTIWQIGDTLPLPQQLAAALVSVAILVFWLITAHHLWEKPGSQSGPDREQAVLYNTSTVLTLTIGVGVLYLGLFVLNLGAAYLLVQPTLLSSTLEHPIEWSSYLNLAWGFTTMGVVAGALGSSLENDEAVRQAAYGYREEQRRARYQREQAGES